MNRRSVLKAFTAALLPAIPAAQAAPAAMIDPRLLADLRTFAADLITATDDRTWSVHRALEGAGTRLTALLDAAVKGGCQEN